MDIVERLRSWLNHDLCDYIEPAIPDIAEAADEIERLRQINAEVVGVLHEICSLRTIPLKNRELRSRLISSIEIAKAAIAKATGGE